MADRHIDTQYGVKSDFIRNAVKGMSCTPESRKYISDLIFLEQSLIEGRSSFAHSCSVDSLIEKYGKEFHIIYREVAPEKYAVYLENQKRRGVRDAGGRREFEEGEKTQRLAELRWWHEMGGKI